MSNQEEPNFFQRAGNTISEGVRGVGNIASDASRGVGNLASDAAGAVKTGYDTVQRGSNYAKGVARWFSIPAIIGYIVIFILFIVILVMLGRRINAWMS